MTCRIKDDSHWDLWKSQGYKPCWSIRWGVYTNSPKRHGSVGIAGQTRVFKDQESAKKYLRGVLRLMLICSRKYRLKSQKNMTNCSG